MQNTLVPRSSRYTVPELLCSRPCTVVFMQVFCLPYLVRINQGVKEKVAKEGLAAVPMTVFAKGGHYALKSLALSGYCTVYSAHCSLHTAHCTLHTAHCTVFYSSAGTRL